MLTTKNNFLQHTDDKLAFHFFVQNNIKHMVQLPFHLPDHFLGVSDILENFLTTDTFLYVNKFFPPVIPLVPPIIFGGTLRLKKLQDL